MPYIHRTDLDVPVAVLHALDSLQPLTEGYQLSPEWRKLVIDLAETDMADLQTRVGTNVEAVFQEGEVTKTVCREAKRLQADLLVLGRGSNKGILGRLTEHAYAIIRQSPCPANFAVFSSATQSQIVVIPGGSTTHVPCPT